VDGSAGCGVDAAYFNGVVDPGHGVLTVNGGASSLKFALFEQTETGLRRVLDGKIERIGSADSNLTTRVSGQAARTHGVAGGTRQAAVASLLVWLAGEPAGQRLSAVGHRIVHGGGRYVEPCMLSADVRAELRKIAPLDPEHLPFELDLIDAIGKERPHLVHVACFDTAFHRTLPKVAQVLPLPHQLFAAGVRRYGFHGLSCTFLLRELERLGGPELARRRWVFAHLGAGASLTAVTDGRSVDTTMAFTPTSGVPMGTRSGDLDPGIPLYLARTAGMSPERFSELVNRESGLLGVSGISADVRDLLERAPHEERAELAIQLFCYEVRKRVGALAAVLGGLDGLVFTGGIGENAAPIRARVCDRLGFLGIQLDHRRNEASEAIISERAAPVVVRVVHTDEERVIAEAVVALVRGSR
jgi:acetate kinase